MPGDVFCTRTPAVSHGDVARRHQQLLFDLFLRYDVYPDRLVGNATPRSGGLHHHRIQLHSFIVVVGVRGGRLNRAGGGNGGQQGGAQRQSNRMGQQGHGSSGRQGRAVAK